MKTNIFFRHSQKLLLALVILGGVLSIGTAVYSSTAHAALMSSAELSTAATNFCKDESQSGNGVAYPDICQRAYKYGYLNYLFPDKLYNTETTKGYCEKDARDEDGNVLVPQTHQIEISACGPAVKAGAERAKKDAASGGGGSGNTSSIPIPSDAEIRAAATKYCQSQGSATQAACEVGYYSGVVGVYSKGDACKLFKGTEQTKCQDAYVAADKTGYELCAGAQKNDCIAGYKGGLEGKTQSEACGSRSGAAKTACNSAWARGNTTLTVATQSNSVQAAEEAANEEPDSCKTLSLNPIKWFVCPLVDGINTFVDELDKAINNLLTIDIGRIFDTTNPNSSGRAYYRAWDSFRKIGIGVIIVSTLVVIIASAFGFEILDAYTIRKTLPRLLIALIAITLSWSILRFVIELANDVGNGVRYIIYAPFADMPGLQLSGSALGLGALMLGVGIAAFELLGMLTFALVALMGVFSAFAVLIIRELIVIFMVILAPFAIACMILPNTRKVWDFWQKTLIGLLIAFPIITGLIALGRVFSQTINAGGEASPINQIIAFMAYLLPYFMLLAIIKMTTGVMGAMANIAQDQGRGMSKGLKVYRGNKFNKRVSGLSHNVKTGQGIPLINRTRAGQRFNRGLQYGASPTALIPGFLGAGARARMSTNLSATTAQAAKQLQELGLQDDTTGNEFAANWNRVNARVRELRGTGDARDAATADQLAAYAQFNGRRDMALGALKLNAGFGKVSDEALEGMDTMFGDTASEQGAKQAAFGDIIFTSKNAGNWVTYGARIGSDGRVHTYHNDEEAVKKNIAEALQNAGPSQLSNIKPFVSKRSDGTVDYNTLEVTATAVAQGVVLAKNEHGSGSHNFQRALEQLAMQRQKGAYNTPNMKAEFDKAAMVLDDDEKEKLRKLEQEMRRREQQEDEELRGS